MFKDLTCKKLANAARFLSVDSVMAANSGHIGMPLGMADALVSLFKDHMIFSPENPTWENRDRFVMSCGHGAPLLYSMLYLLGYRGIKLDDLKNLRQFGSVATGHPEYNPELGIEMTTGLLGQGFASGIGMAIAERLLNKRLGNDCINHYTYICASDGDLMEGISHEAASLAGDLGLGKVIVLFDNNKITIESAFDDSYSENILKRFESYGWHTVEVNGHNEDEVSSAISASKSVTGMPSLISCCTHIGYGSCYQDKCKAHSSVLTEEQANDLRSSLEWPYAPFEIPNAVLQTWREIGAKNISTEKRWTAAHSQTFKSVKEETKEVIKKVTRSVKKNFFISRPFLATRKSSEEIVNDLCAESRFIISGSADLGKSTGCLADSSKIITKNDFSGNYIQYGIREQSMGAVINGITLHGGLIAFGGTFFAFSDYMKPSIRMAAMMEIPSIFVFSHDSIGVGEDGPTHQPVEQLASLRSIPNLNVLRPADAMETLECWQIALGSKYPSAIILTRQEVRSIRFCGRDNLCAKGGYLLNKDKNNSSTNVTIIATGSEVGIALEVQNILVRNAISVNIVSMPCWNLFDAQDEPYKEEVLGSDLRIVVEAASRFGWEKYLGENGMFFGVEGFGFSAPQQDIFEKFGLTAQNISYKILERLNSH